MSQKQLTVIMVADLPLTVRFVVSLLADEGAEMLFCISNFSQHLPSAPHLHPSVLMGQVSLPGSGQAFLMAFQYVIYNHKYNHQKAFHRLYTGDEKVNSASVAGKYNSTTP